MLEADRKVDEAAGNLPGREVVLCVDDEFAVLNALRRLLRPERYVVATTDDPQTALEYVRSRFVDVVIADQRMPGMTGAELLKAVRDVSPSTGRVLLTGYPSESLEEECRYEGVQRFVTKPWRDDELRRIVREVIGERERAEGYLEIY